MPRATKGSRLKTEEVKIRLLKVHKLIKDDGLTLKDACAEHGVAQTSYNRYLNRGFFKTAAATVARMERKALRDAQTTDDPDDTDESPLPKPRRGKGKSNGRRTSKGRRKMRRYSPEDAKRLVAEVKRLSSHRQPPEDRMSIPDACEHVDIGMSTYHRYKDFLGQVPAAEPVVTETKIPSTKEEFLKHEIQRLNHRIESIQMTNLKLIQCVAQSIEQGI